MKSIRGTPIQESLPPLDLFVGRVGVTLSSNCGTIGLSVTASTLTVQAYVGYASGPLFAVSATTMDYLVESKTKKLSGALTPSGKTGNATGSISASQFAINQVNYNHFQIGAVNSPGYFSLTGDRYSSNFLAGTTGFCLMVDEYPIRSILLEPQDEGGFVAFSGEYQGAVGEGETEEEAVRDLEESIQLLREVLEEDKQK